MEPGPKFDIDPSSWAALNLLLDTALDLAPDERSAWVDGLGPEYDGLKGRLRDLLSRSEQSGSLIDKNDFALRYLIDPYRGRLWLPEIPARGEITVYYDMYSHLNIQRFEVGGRAMLGDPTDLSGGPGIRLTRQQDGASEVPEPATMVLFGGGLVVIGALRRARVWKRGSGPGRHLFRDRF